ncbi:MAG: glycosyltransferase family 4 protein [Geminicoccaceae bacterium]
MNVLYLARTWQFGGSSTIILSLIRHLPEHGVRVLFAPYESGTEADREFTGMASAAGATILDTAMPWQGWTSWPAARACLKRVCNEHRIDVVHSHENLSTTIVGLGPKLRPRIATAYGWWERDLKLKAFFAIERRLALPRFDRVLTVADSLRRRIVAAGTAPERVEVVRTGIDLPRLPDPDERAALRALFGIPPSALVIGVVGRLAPEKGHGVLLQALSGLVANRPDLFLLVAGSGPSRPEIEARVAALGLDRQVRLAGFVPETRDAYAAMDLFALPSILPEGFPTVVIEAQAMSLPVVATDIGGTGETLLPGTTGVLVEPRSVEALRAALARLVSDPDLMTRMGASGRAYVARLTVPSMVGKVATAYATVATPRPAR